MRQNIRGDSMPGTGKKNKQADYLYLNCVDHRETKRRPVYQPACAWFRCAAVDIFLLLAYNYQKEIERFTVY